MINMLTSLLMEQNLARAPMHLNTCSSGGLFWNDGLILSLKIQVSDLEELKDGHGELGGDVVEGGRALLGR